MKLLGFEIKRFTEDESPAVDGPITPPNDDGALVLQDNRYGVYLDLNGTYTNEIDLINQYRGMSMQPEMENAIDDVVNESIVVDVNHKSVEIFVDNLDVSDKIKQMITNEFDEVMELLDFNKYGQDIFRKWYIDGRLNYNVVIDKENPREGIKALVYIDPRKIKKVRQIHRDRDQVTGADVVKSVEEFYLYNEKIVNNMNQKAQMEATYAGAVKLTADSVVQVVSGLYDPIKATVLSYLHKAIRPMNQLRFVEDATVIYRVSRAPERRVFYVDVGNMNKQKAESYLKSLMTNYRNKLTYDASTGQIKDDRKHMSMLEDFWMPRRGEGKGTEITTLPGGNNTNANDEVLYFEKKLYRALGIPVSRLEQNQGFTIGKSNEITRDELKFDKQIDRFRSRFSVLFDELMERQLVLKGVCTLEEWKQFKQKIFYDFKKDNNFTELKEAELLSNRVQTMVAMQPFIGVFYSKEFIYRKVMRLNDEEIQEMEQQLDTEFKKATADDHPPHAGQPYGMPGPEGAMGAPPPEATQAPPAPEQPEGEEDINTATGNFLDNNGKQ